MGMLIEETYVNLTEGYRMGESGAFESVFEPGKGLLKHMMKYYGRCTSKVYVDGPDGKAQHIGYCFLKREQYEDTKETYLRETWVVFLKSKPRTVTHYDYITL